MKIIYRISVLIFFGIFANSFTANAQLFEIKMEQKMEHSSMIIEGEVLEQQSYHGPDDRVYTANKIKVYKLYKGRTVQGAVTVITMGGRINGAVSTWTHLLELSKGQFGVFFLTDTHRPFDGSPGYPEEAFEVYASSQGFLKYSFEGGRLAAAAPFCQYRNVKNELAEHFAASFGEPVELSTPFWDIKESGKESCLVYMIKFDQSVPTHFPFEMEAMVYVKSTEGSFHLNQAAVVANYDASVLGVNIVQSGVFGFENIGISSQANYTVEADDIAADKVEVKVKAASGSPMGGLVQMTEDFTELIKLKLTLSQFVDPEILLEQSSMQVLTELYNPETGRPERVKCIKIEDGSTPTQLCDPPVIMSFEPDCVRAGTDDTLTIRGINFGDTPGRVGFTSSKAGPDPIFWIDNNPDQPIIWTDTLIQVYVPSILGNSDMTHSAGTGFIRVDSDCFPGEDKDTSDTQLCVTYSVLNDKAFDYSVPVFLANWNGMGGQSIVYDEDFKSDAGAVAAFERALVKWRCATGVNYIIQDPAEVDLLTTAIVGFDVLAIGVLGGTNTFEMESCFENGEQISSRRRRFFMVFNNVYTWHTEEAMPMPLDFDASNNNPIGIDTFDLESTALHELGHAHLLQHSNDSTDLMFVRKPYGVEYRREITPNSLAGGLYVMELENANIQGECFTGPMSKLTGDCTKVTDVIEIGSSAKVEITLFPNPNNGTLNVSLDYQKTNSKTDLKWILYDLNGHSIYSGMLQSNTKINLSDLPAGMYYFNVYSDEVFVKSFKVIKQ